MPKFLHLHRDEGARQVHSGAYNGRKIEVATGYDARGDCWPATIYIDGKKQFGTSIQADTHREAVDSAEAAAIELIDGALV